MHANEPRLPRIPQFVYFGLDAERRPKLGDGSRRYTVEGSATKLASLDDAKVDEVKRLLNAASSRLADLRPAPTALVAVGNKSGHLYLVHGHIREVTGETDVSAQRSTTRRPMSVKKYQLEIKRIKASQELGTDPKVDMPFIARHSGRSIPTVYRDITAGLLAKASKCGSASRWSFSAVDAYANGRRPGDPTTTV